MKDFNFRVILFDCIVRGMLQLRSMGIEETSKTGKIATPIYFEMLEAMSDELLIKTDKRFIKYEEKNIRKI